MNFPKYRIGHLLCGLHQNDVFLEEPQSSIEYINNIGIILGLDGDLKITFSRWPVLHSSLLSTA